MSPDGSDPTEARSPSRVIIFNLRSGRTVALQSMWDGWRSPRQRVELMWAIQGISLALLASWGSWSMLVVMSVTSL